MIRRPRRTFAGALLAAAVLLGAPPAEGQLADGEFTSPSADEPADVRARPRQIAGELTYRGLPGSTFTAMELTFPEHPTCPNPPAPVSGDPIDPTVAAVDVPATARFSFSDVAPFCNGRYTARVEGTIDEPVEDSVVVTSVPFSVALPAPPVTGLTATVGADRAVTLTWGVPAGWEGGAPPDFADFDGAGYSVERAVGDGPFEPIAATGRDERTHVDTLAPADATTVRYRVVATRGDGEGGVVAGDAASAPVTDATFPPPPSTSTTGARPRIPVANAPARGRPRIQTLPGVGPGTTIDDGFEGTLPFDDVEPGGRDAVLPEDAAEFLQEGDNDASGAGVLIPTSIATLLAAWALHLRYLARRAALPG